MLGGCTNSVTEPHASVDPTSRMRAATLALMQSDCDVNARRLHAKRPLERTNGWIGLTHSAILHHECVQTCHAKRPMLLRVTTMDASRAIAARVRSVTEYRERRRVCSCVTPTIARVRSSDAMNDESRAMSGIR